MRSRIERLIVAAVAAIVTVLVLGSGCSRPHLEGQSPQSVGSCPVERLVDPTKKATEEIDLTVDKSASFINSSAARARVEAQVRAAVEAAVEQNAAMRVLVFAGSVATVRVVVVCPVMAAKFNNPAARENRTTYLRQVAADQVWAAVRDAQPAKGGSGTSVVGGWVAMAEAAPLASHRHALMLSDGRGGQEDSDVDLAGFATVGMFSVGRVATTASGTESTTALIDRWKQWLTRHGAAPAGLTVTSGEFR
jgi:hypothetical protein